MRTAMRAGPKITMNWLDRAIASVAPRAALRRVHARTQFAHLARHYDAASSGRRTGGWHRPSSDANAANGPSLAVLRSDARELVRNNAWARNGLRVIARNTVGWGIVPKALESRETVSAEIAAIWKAWAGTPECDADGRATFYGLEKQVIRMVAESGEALVRRRWRRTSDGLTIPLQVQLLEPDLIDTSKDGIEGMSGGKVVQGVELDALGRRSAYWLFDEHPGSRSLASLTSRRIPASEVVHVFDLERVGALRGVTWFAAAILNLKDFDEYEDGTIIRQKIAALFAAFVTDPNGNPDDTLGPASKSDEKLEELEPGMIKYLQPGQTVEFATPPLVANDGFSARTLRRIAAAIGVTYEDLTGDYSQVNFSSARMARLAHWANVYDWQWNMMVPQFCDRVWGWAMEAAAATGRIDTVPGAEWTAPPIPMIDPDKEGLAYTRRVRSGQMTYSEMIREQGKDPEAHLREYAEDQKKLDALGIWLDSDVRRVSAAGLTQERAGAGGGGSGSGTATE